jgi:SPP1 family predicted phage head-tail adaptor
MPSLRAGTMRHRITFQNRVETQDANTGALTETWTDAFTCWASIDPLNGRELIAAAAVQSGVTHSITVRYRDALAVPAVTASMRILYGSRIFNIKASMNESESRHTITLQAEEGLTTS